MASIKSYKVKDIMKQTDQFATSDQRISEILGRMKKQHIYELPVVEKGKVLGIIDLDKLIKSRRLPLTSEVKHVMINNPAISPEDSLPTVARIMISSDLKGIPVCADGCSLACPIHGIVPVSAVTTHSYVNGKLIITYGAVAACGAIITPPNRGHWVE